MSTDLQRHALVSLMAARLFNESLPDPATWDLMRSDSIEPDLVCDLAGPIVCQNAGFYTDRFELDPLGEACLVMSVLGEDAETTVDLVGWSAQEPERFASMFGTCGTLGIDQLLNPATYYGGLPCPIWQTPWNWLKAGCRGVVVLDGDKAHSEFRMAKGLLAVESVEHGRDLVLSGRIPESRLVVPAPLRRAA
jgi:hypothetical protein